MVTVGGGAATVATRGFAAQVGQPSWNALVASGSARSFQRNDIMLLQGDADRAMTLVLHGRVKVVYVDTTGEEFMVAVRGPGDLLGELAGMGDGRRSATIRALEPCRVVQVADRIFRDILAKADRQDVLERYVAGKLRQSATAPWRISSRRVSYRLAHLLLTVAEAAGERPAPVPMVQQELADALGVSRRHVHAALNRWRDLGLVALQRGQVTLLDTEALRWHVDG